MDSSGQKRLFIALDLPDEIKAKLQTICVGLKEVRWVQPEQMHLTIRFLGDSSAPQFESVRESLKAIRFEPFEVSLQKAGQFPQQGSARVIWVEMVAPGTLSRLVRDVERSVTALGYAPETKRFVPHITVARVKTPIPTSEVKDYFKRFGRFQTDPFQVNKFTLFSSVLKKSGPVYTVEAEYPARSV